MKRILNFLILSFIIFFVSSAFAKPGFVVVPFANNINMAPYTKMDVLIVAQNNTTVNQTVTNIRPEIPSNSGITATIKETNCSFLSPGSICTTVVTLQSTNQVSISTCNVSICSFNGAYCSHIEKPLRVNIVYPFAIRITPQNKVIAQSTTQQFSAFGFFPNGFIQDMTNYVSWSSSQPTHATISNNSGSQGLATGVGVGPSGISASYGALTDSTLLTVTSATLTSISITPISSSIAKGTNKQFNATGIFSDGSKQDITSLVTWSSSNTTIASISNQLGQKGLALGNNTGTTTISAAFRSVSSSANLIVAQPVLSSISVTPSNPVSAVETTQQFYATGIFSDNSTQNLTQLVSWSTQSPAIAIVSNLPNSKGLAIGKSSGTTSVTAKLGSISGSTNFQVIDVNLVKIDIVPVEASISAGLELAYRARGVYSNNSTQDLTTEVTWGSTNVTIATISNSSGSQGVATGQQAGTTTIYAQLGAISGQAQLHVTSPNLLSIAITPEATTIPNGSQQQFNAMGTYSDASKQDLTAVVTWSSSSPLIADISNAPDSPGLAQALSVGITNIEATYKGVSDSTSLTISAATLVSIAITPANSSIPISAKKQYTATGTYSDTSTHDITQDVVWYSSNQSIATISNDDVTKGTATAIALGTTTITATDGNGITNSTPLHVTVSSSGDCYVYRDPASSSYWMGYQIFTNSAPFRLDFSATGIDLLLLTINGNFENVIVEDSSHLLIPTKPDWVNINKAGFMGFYPTAGGSYEPLATSAVATCHIL